LKTADGILPDFDTIGNNTLIGKGSALWLIKN
jgi:hypothetical protein